MNSGISYTVQFSSRSKRLTIKVDSHGEVIVTAPERFPKYRIAEFVEASRGWILAQLSTQVVKPVLLSATNVYYFGKNYEVKVSRSFDGSVHVGKEIIIVAPLLSSLATHVERNSSEVRARDERSVGQSTELLLQSWLKSRAIEYVTKRVYELGALMHCEFRGLAFKQQKTRWGSCSSLKNLNFNWKLIHAPKDVIDYVIIHELAHTKHMNHGKGFWDFVSQFDPDHTLHRRWLSRFGSTED